jgi:hypothetical protein
MGITGAEQRESRQSALSRFYPVLPYDEEMLAEWLSDTEPRALEVYLKLQREMTPGERLARVFELCEFQGSLQIANVRASYPKASEREIFLRVAARRLGRELMIAAYNWDPDRHP